MRIAEYGRIRAERRAQAGSEDWMNEHYTMMGGVFETEFRHRRILRNEDVLPLEERKRWGFLLKSGSFL